VVFEALEHESQMLQVLLRAVGGHEEVVDIFEAEGQSLKHSVNEPLKGLGCVS